MADPGEGPGGSGPPRVFRPNWCPKGRKKVFFNRPLPPPPPYVTVWMIGALALSDGLDPPLKSWEVGLKCKLVGEFELQGFYCSIAWAHWKKSDQTFFLRSPSFGSWNNWKRPPPSILASCFWVRFWRYHCNIFPVIKTSFVFLGFNFPGRTIKTCEMTRSAPKILNVIQPIRVFL